MACSRKGVRLIASDSPGRACLASFNETWRLTLYIYIYIHIYITQIHICVYIYIYIYIHTRHDSSLAARKGHDMVDTIHLSLPSPSLPLYPSLSPLSPSPSPSVSLSLSTLIHLLRAHPPCGIFVHNFLWRLGREAQSAWSSPHFALPIIYILWYILIYYSIVSYMIPYHTIYYNMLYCTILYCTILYYTILYYIILLLRRGVLWSLHYIPASGVQGCGV